MDSLCPFFKICTAVGGGCEERTHDECQRFLKYVKVNGKWKANAEEPSKNSHLYYDHGKWVRMLSTRILTSREKYKRNNK